MQYKIIVDKQSSSNPSSEKKEYIVDIEELRVKGDVYDSLVITKDETYVMRRLSLSKYHVLNELEEPIKETLTDLNIELFEGDNYIYLLDQIGNVITVTYILKNDFTDTYATRIEMNSSIEQTAEDITSTVSKTYTTKTETNELSTRIKQTAHSIELTTTDNETSAGITIKLKNEDGTQIDSKSANITMTGLVKFTDLSTSGSTVINGANITTGTITGRTITGGKIIGTTITNGNNFNVDSNGNMTCNNGNFSGDITIGGDDSLWILDGNDEQYILLDAGGIAFFQDSIFTNSINRTHYETGNRKGISIKTQNTNSYITIGHLDNIALEFVAQDEKIYINTKTHFSEIPTINGTADGAIFKGATTKGITIENGLITGWNIAAATGIIFPDAADGIQVENGLITGWYLNGATGTLYLADSGSGNQVTIQVKNGLITGWTV